MNEFEQMIELLRGANLDSETVQTVTGLIRSAAKGTTELKTRASELEGNLEAATAENSELRSLVESAVAEASEARTGLTDLTARFDAIEERAGAFPNSVGLRGSRSGEGDADEPLIDEARLDEADNDHTLIRGNWATICNGYKKRYGDFAPRFAPVMAASPSHVAGLQAVVLPGETPRFVDTTQSNGPAYLR